MDPTTVALACPKCSATMRVIERSGIHLEQCPECRGIFLDRGELDRLLDMEAADVRSAGRRGEDRRGSSQRWDEDEDADWDEGTRRRGPDRRGGFLSDLFQGFGD